MTTVNVIEALAGLLTGVVVHRWVVRRPSRVTIRRALHLPSVSPEVAPHRDPWEDAVPTHAEVVKWLPAGIANDFRPPSPFAPIAAAGISVDHVCRGWLTPSEARTYPGELVELRDLAHAEPRYLVVTDGALDEAAAATVRDLMTGIEWRGTVT